MCLLPWSGDLIHHLLHSFGSDHNSTAVVLPSGIVAAVLILALNVAIQPVQMGIRALIIDTCPPHQQVEAMAYSSCITGVGSVLGYASGFMNLSSWLPWLGDTQFKCLSVAASLALGSTVAVTLFVIKEKEVIFDIEGDNRGTRVFEVVRQVLHSVRLMPTGMKRVCKAQFFAWMGWFPFLFYITT